MIAEEQVPAVERPVRVLVVDDEPMIVQMLTMGLRYEKFEVYVAQSGLEALEIARSVKLELVILDIMLPGMNGLDVCRELCRIGDMGIIMLTARGELEDRIAGLEGGADDYQVKPFAFGELLARIRAVLRRRGVNTQNVLRVGNITLYRNTRLVEYGASSFELTPREFELLELFMLHPRQVFSREAIVNQVWGYEYLGDTNIVDVYVRYLREKLADSDRSLIRSVRGVGYALEPAGGAV